MSFKQMSTIISISSIYPELFSLDISDLAGSWIWEETIRVDGETAGRKKVRNRFEVYITELQDYVYELRDETDTILQKGSCRIRNDVLVLSGSPETEEPNRYGIEKQNDGSFRLHEVDHFSRLNVRIFLKKRPVLN